MLSSVAFSDGPPDTSSALFVINQLVNVIFILDMVFNFLLPYEANGRTHGRNGRYMLMSTCR